MPETIYKIKNQPTLKKILWADVILGGGTAIIGLLFITSLTTLLGLPTNLIQIISIVTMAYAIFAFLVVMQKTTSISLLRILIFANWIWTAISIGLLFTHFEKAALLGQFFLLLQILVVGGLAYMEGKQVIKLAVSS